MKYTVYLRTNKVNGMQYVGQSGDFKERERCWNNLKIKYANKFLTLDREKYGLANFDLKILTEVDTREEAWELEQKYIKELGSKFPNGYNRADGGKNSKGTEFTKEHRELLSKIKKDAHIVPKSAFKEGNEPWNKGVKDCFSEYTLKAMSEKHKGKHHSPATEFKKGLTPWIKGKHHTAESNEKNRLAHLGKILPTRKPIIQLTLDGKYIKETFIKDAAKELGFKSDESIRKACKENWRTSGGFKWMYKSDYEKMLEEQLSL